jgi:hypothetical protein
LVAVPLATTVWRIRPELVAALDEQLGPPVDSYVNGSQTWFTETKGGATAVAPGGGAGAPADAAMSRQAKSHRQSVMLEWRLHPVAGYRGPAGLSHYDLWETVVGQLAAGTGADAMKLGSETRALSTLWDGLECFPAHADDLEPATLSAAATAALGLAPDAAGLVEHERIGDAWERSRGAVSIVGLLLDQLGASP